MIETSRLLLRSWKESDLAPYAQMNADPAVREFFPSILTPEQSAIEIQHFKQTYSSHGFCFFAAELRGTGEFAGFVGLQTMNFAIPGVRQPAVEIGWRLAHAYWGNGLATEGARAVLEYAFSRADLKEVVAITVPANLRSQRVMRKLGMERRPESDFHHPQVAPEHPLSRHLLYWIARTDSTAGDSAYMVVPNSVE